MPFASTAQTEEGEKLLLLPCQQKLHVLTCARSHCQNVSSNHIIRITQYPQTFLISRTKKGHTQNLKRNYWTSTFSWRSQDRLINFSLLSWISTFLQYSPSLVLHATSTLQNLICSEKQKKGGNKPNNVYGFQNYFVPENTISLIKFLRFSEIQCCWRQNIYQLHVSWKWENHPDDGILKVWQCCNGHSCC